MQGFTNFPPVTIVLIIINIAIYIFLPIIPDGNAIYSFSVLSPVTLLSGEWWTLFTSMFLHSGITHIACNMFSLYYLGSLCEKVFGSLKFLILYFISGIIGGLVYVGVNIIAGDYLSSAVGASGAIFGLFGAYGYMLLRESRQNRIFAYPLGKSAIYSYVVILAINFFIDLVPGSNIATSAHIGGMVAGFIIGAIFYTLIIRKLPYGGNYSSNVTNYRR